jgi:hypothetical protein
MSSATENILDASSAIIFIVFIVVILYINNSRIKKGWRPVWFCYPFCCWYAPCGCCGLFKRGTDEPNNEACIGIGCPDPSNSTSADEYSNANGGDKHTTAYAKLPVEDNTMFRGVKMHEFV